MSKHFSSRRIHLHGVHLYDWDQEPIGGRRSEFASTDFGAASTLGPTGPRHAGSAQRRRSGRVGARTLLVFIVALLVVGGWTLRRYVPALGLPLRAAVVVDDASRASGTSGSVHRSLRVGQRRDTAAVDHAGSLSPAVERT